MKNQRVNYLLLAAAVLLAACTGGPAAPAADPTATPDGSLPLCSPAGLLAPIIAGPTDGQIGPEHGLEVITEVYYPSTACQPEGFERQVSLEPSTLGDNHIINPSPVNIFGGLSSYNGGGQLTTTLENCTQYYWRARAFVGATYGPYSTVHTFFTDVGGGCIPPASIKTVCAAAGLLAPVIESPSDGEVNPVYGSEVITAMHYPDPNCVPEYFEKQVTENEDFSGANYIINPGPVNIPMPVGEFSGSGQITIPLNDCTQYYLRARAVADGQNGPYSETITFFTDFNAACELPASFSLAPVIVPSRNANCRLGPSATHFDIVDTLFAGQSYAPIGIGPDQLWLLFRGPVYGANCWVFIQNLEFNCKEQAATPNDLGRCQLAVVRYPALPTATPTPTPQPTATPMPQCSDGLDNDGDGYVDLADRECKDASDNDESQ
ncbi:MAG: hypothetical protein KIS88_07230 [Anaerolineales bacterium]|nr:hypothetical protein [Anaerolineales bacterium]